MIPGYIKYDSLSTPPQWTDGSDQIIEKGTHVRIKLKGIRNEVGEMFAIATINEDFLGYEATIISVPDLFAKYADQSPKNPSELFSRQTLVSQPVSLSSALDLRLDGKKKPTRDTSLWDEKWSAETLSQPLLVE
jgi:hypothetical protein